MLRQEKLSERRSCLLVGIHRSTYRRKRKKRSDDELKAQLLKLAQEKPRFGCRRLTDELRSKGMLVNKKRVHRVYKELKLAVRVKKRKKRYHEGRGVKPFCTAPNQVWSLDFQSDQLATGRRFRLLNIIDNFTRECLQIEVDTSLTGKRVASVLNRLKALRGLPDQIMMDNGPELRSRAMENWSIENKVTLWFIEPGKPMQNALIESFNGRLRDECLNCHWFTDLDDARLITHSWKNDYNFNRRHSSLQSNTPSQFAALHGASAKKISTITGGTTADQGIITPQSRVS